MKYSELNLGQIEALVNKLGGVGVVKAILAGQGEITGSSEERAFIKSLDKCLAIREVFQGCGNYNSEDGRVFPFMALEIANKSGNLAENAIHENAPFDEGINTIINDMIVLALRKLVEFQIYDGEGFESAENYLEDIKNGLREGDKIEVLKSACHLRSYILGVERLNLILLDPFDTANSLGKYKRSGK